MSLKCDICGKELNASVEIVTGLCGRHQTLLESNKSYAGICWTCGEITLIEEIPRRLKHVWNPSEKYLFTKECSHCTGDIEDDIKWITFERFIPPHKMVVNEVGHITKISGIPPEEQRTEKHIINSNTSVIP